MLRGNWSSTITSARQLSRVVAPAVEVSGGGLLVEVGEPLGYPGVERGIFAEPLVAELAVFRVALAAEPEVQYFPGPTRHGR